MSDLTAATVLTLAAALAGWLLWRHRRPGRHRTAGWWSDLRDALGRDRSPDWLPGELLAGTVHRHRSDAVSAQPGGYVARHAETGPRAAGRVLALPPAAAARLAVLDGLWDLAARQRDLAVAA